MADTFPDITIASLEGVSDVWLETLYEMAENSHDQAEEHERGPLAGNVESLAEAILAELRRRRSTAAHFLDDAVASLKLAGQNLPTGDRLALGQALEITKDVRQRTRQGAERGLK